MRLRILDINTPWFWLTFFYEPIHYGKPTFTLSLWEPHKWKRFWLYFWLWEPLENYEALVSDSESMTNA